MIFIVLALFLVGFMGFALADEESDCQDSGGTWEQFTNGCVDSCELARESSDDPIACTQAITMGCDCGEDECWNGEACEDNETDNDSDLNETDDDNDLDLNETEEEEIEIEIEEEFENETGKYKRKVKIHRRNRLRINQSELPENCTRTGSVIKCNIEGGRVMAIMAGRSGNIILKVRGINMTTSMELYHHNGKVYGALGDNESILINYFPDQIREIIRNRINTDIEYEEEIELDENGLYRVKTKKKARLFYLIPVREKVRAQVNPETGEIIKIRNPWWGFLAKDVVDDDEDDNNTDLNETDELENNESAE